MKKKITQKTLWLGSSEIRQGLREQSKREVRSQENSQDAERENEIKTYLLGSSLIIGSKKLCIRIKG